MKVEDVWDAISQNQTRTDHLNNTKVLKTALCGFNLELGLEHDLLQVWSPVLVLLATILKGQNPTLV